MGARRPAVVYLKQTAFSLTASLSPGLPSVSGERVRITDHIHPIKIPFEITVAPGKTMTRFVYAYLVEADVLTLVDTGVAGSEQLIFDHIEKMGKAPGDLGRIILTHSHPDHIGSAPSIRERCGCEVLAHPAERAWIEDTERQGRERPVPGFDRLVEGPVKVDRLVTDGDLIGEGDGQMEVIHTPGHSSGSISLHLSADRALITADAVPIPKGMPIYDDVTSSVSSIKRLSRVSPVEVLLSSWDDPRYLPQQRFDVALTFLQSIHREVLAHADGGMNMEVCQSVLKKVRLPPAMANPLVMRSLASHLRYRDVPDIRA